MREGEGERERRKRERKRERERERERRDRGKRGEIGGEGGYLPRTKPIRVFSGMLKRKRHRFHLKVVGHAQVTLMSSSSC